MSKLDLINYNVFGSSLETFPKSSPTGRSELKHPPKRVMHPMDPLLTADDRTELMNHMGAKVNVVRKHWPLGTIRSLKAKKGSRKTRSIFVVLG